MTTCPACGANVDLAVDVDTDERVPLEKYTDASGDAARYRIVALGPPLSVARVPDNAPGDFYPDHRFDCKDANAGRTF
jgi:hypothetical protein